MERAFRITRIIGQWVLIFGFALAALGLIGGFLYLIHHPMPLFIDFGVLALPALFLGLVILLIAAVFEHIHLRRSSRT
jgi:uncharacterized membrane protein YhdT